MATKAEKIDEFVTLQAEIQISWKAVHKAIRWARERKYTYERDKEWGDMLLAFLLTGDSDIGNELNIRDAELIGVFDLMTMANFTA